MPEWCHNRLEITGKSVSIDFMLQWINGTDVPRHHHDVQQSTAVAGRRGTSYPPCQSP